MIKLALLCTALTAPTLLGAQWTLLPMGTDAEFRGLSVLGTKIVWASGTRGRVARTADGGNTWTVDTIEGASALDLRDIVGMSARRAWTISSGPAEEGQAQILGILGGARSDRRFQTDQKGVFLDAVKFWDARHGIALSDPVNGKLFLLSTRDGGATWTQLNTDHAPAVLPGEASFAASGTCLAVHGTSNVWIGTGGGERARVFRSRDRGRSWTVADTPVHARSASSGIFSVAFTDDRHGVVSGGDYAHAHTASANVALTDDGGSTWHLSTGVLPQGYMSAVAYVPQTRGRSLVAVGLAGTARSIDGGESWSMIDTVPYNSVAFASRTLGWAAGPGGRIARWTPSTTGSAKP